MSTEIKRDFREWHVKVRRAGEKRYLFLTSRLTLEELRIHAGRFSEKAKAIEMADRLLAANKDVDAAVVINAATSRVAYRSVPASTPPVGESS